MNVSIAQQLLRLPLNKIDLETAAHRHAIEVDRSMCRYTAYMFKDASILTFDHWRDYEPPSVA